MSITSDLTTIKNKADGLANNKVTNFAYDSTAYSANTVASPESYDWSQHNNIPQQTTSAMKMTETQIDKGWRLRFPILNKYFFNAFFGRVSYNLNKLSDLFQSTLTALINALGTANGIATLDSSGRLPASQATETLLSYKGAWLASTNTPALSDGMAGAVKGDMYLCDDAGTVTFGTGNTWSFLPNDRVVYNGTKWSKWSAGSVRRVSEILPDGTGNVDLTQQSDITKVLNPKILGELFYWGIGKNWVKCMGGESYTFRGATYGNGIWVAFSANQGLWWSTDGKSWTKSTTSEIASYGFRCAYYLNGIWVAGSDSHGVWWSEDGKTWTAGTGNTGATVYNIAYANSLYVSANSNGVWWSADGKAWTQGTGVTSQVNNIIYANNLWVLASASAGFWWSSDGKSWTQGTGNTTGQGFEIVYGNGLFVSACLGGCWWSADGKAWTQGTGLTTDTGTVKYANGIFVAGSAGAYYSTDGKAWTIASSISSSLFPRAIKYANGIWLTGTTAGGVFISTDGINWAMILSSNIQDGVPFNRISFFEGMFVIGTTAGLYYSDWTTVL